MALNIALFLIVILALFAIGWRVMPSGWLTATTGSLSALVIALHEAMASMMPQLTTAMPAEYQPWLVIMLLLLTVAARFRNRAEE